MPTYKPEDHSCLQLSMPQIRKRPYPADSVGLDNYKRQKLIEDFENLSLTDRKPSHGNDDGVLSTVATTRIHIPELVKKKLMNNEGGIRDSTNDRTIIYAKIIDWMKEETMQLVKWNNWPLIVYHNWMNWIQHHAKQFWQFSHDLDGDYNIDNPILAQFDESSTIYENSTTSEDMDIDIDY